MLDAELARQAVRLALVRGATDAECTLAEGQEFSAQVRMRELDAMGVDGLITNVPDIARSVVGR